MAERAPLSPDTGGFAEFGDDDMTRWESIARRYRPALRGFFSNRIRNPADVDDFVQEVFVQLIRRGRGTPIEHVDRYLFQVAANVLCDQSRRQNVRHHYAHDSYDEVVHAVATELSPERVLLGEESMGRVAAVLEKLPERMRDIFFLRAMDRCKFSDIARMLGISKSTAEKEMAKVLMYLDRAVNEADEAGTQ